MFYKMITKYKTKSIKMIIISRSMQESNEKLITSVNNIMNSLS